MFGLLRRRSSRRRSRPSRPKRARPVRRKRVSSLRKVLRPSKSKRRFGGGGGGSSSTFTPTTSLVSTAPTPASTPTPTPAPSAPSAPSVPSVPAHVLTLPKVEEVYTSSAAEVEPEVDDEKVREIISWYSDVLSKEITTTLNSPDEVSRSKKYARVAKKILKDVLDNVHTNLFNCLKFDRKWSSLEYLTKDNVIKSKIDAYKTCTGNTQNSQWWVKSIDLLLRTVQAAIRESDVRSLTDELTSAYTFCEYLKKRIGDVNSAVNTKFESSIECKDSTSDSPAVQMVTTKFSTDENRGYFSRKHITDADRCERRPYAWLFGNSTFISRTLALMNLAYAEHIVGPHNIHKVLYRGRTYIILGECHRPLGTIAPSSRPIDEKIITVTNWIRCILTLMPNIPVDLLTEKAPFSEEKADLRGATLGKMFDYFDVLNDPRTRYKSRILPNVRFHQWDIRAFDPDLSNKLYPTILQGPYGRSKQPASVEYAAKPHEVTNLKDNEIPGFKDTDTTTHDNYVRHFIDTKVKYAMRDLPKEEQDDILAYTSTDETNKTEWFNYLRTGQKGELTDGPSQAQGQDIAWWAKLTDIYSIIRMIRKFPGNNNGIVIVYGGSAHTNHYLQFFDYLKQKHAATQIQKAYRRKPKNVKFGISHPVHIESYMQTDDCRTNNVYPVPSASSSSNLLGFTRDLFGFDASLLNEIRAIKGTMDHETTPIFDRALCYRHQLWSSEHIDNVEKSRPTFADLLKIMSLTDTNVKRELLLHWMYVNIYLLRSKKKKLDYYKTAIERAKLELGDEQVGGAGAVATMFGEERVHPEYSLTWKNLYDKMMKVTVPPTKDERLAQLGKPLFSDDAIGIYNYKNDRDPMEIKDTKGDTFTFEKAKRAYVNTNYEYVGEYMSVVRMLENGMYRCIISRRSDEPLHVLYFDLSKDDITKNFQKVPSIIVRSIRIAQATDGGAFQGHSEVAGHPPVVRLDDTAWWPSDEQTKKDTYYEVAQARQTFSFWNNTTGSNGTSARDTENNYVARKLTSEYPYEPDDNSVLYIAPSNGFQNVYLPQTREEYENEKIDTKMWDDIADPDNYRKKSVFVRLRDDSGWYKKGEVAGIEEEHWRDIKKRYRYNGDGTYTDLKNGYELDVDGDWVYAKKYKNKTNYYNVGAPVELRALRNGIRSTDWPAELSSSFGRSVRRKKDEFIRAYCAKKMCSRDYALKKYKKALSMLR